MRIDVNAFIGQFPFRRIEGGTARGLRDSMQRVGIDQAWVSHLSSLYWRDPTEGNPELYEIAATDPALRPVPAVHPGLANWSEVLDRAVERQAPAVRVDPTFYGVDPAGAVMSALARGAASRGLPLMLAVRLEDGRQRHPNDGAAELAPWAVRSLIRADPGLRLIVTHADREFIEQVHWGATPAESARLLWDICWIWGPPEDHLEHLVRTVGADRFCFGTGMPVRIPENSVAKLDLLGIPAADRAKIEHENAIRQAAGSR